MSDLTPHRTSLDIAGRVTLGLTMIDSRKAAIIRDRFWRERTWPAIAKERHCCVTTAVKRFKLGMEDLRRAILLVEGRLSESTTPPGSSANAERMVTFCAELSGVMEQTGFPPLGR
jgi:hypothetical protein